jgi:three-Cys-motif partner protein
MGAIKNFFEEKKPWSIFKDSMLDWYLTPYIRKLLYTNKPLYIIDCFAGKGKFDDGTLGSPLIIANKIEGILDDSKVTNKDIHGIFIEKKYSDELKINLYGYDKCTAYHGDFEESIDKICKLAERANLFLYIDPYGIKCLKFDYINKICEHAKYSLEMFINFNSIGFIREACRVLRYMANEILEDDLDENYEVQELSIDNLNKIFNGHEWMDLVNRFYKRDLSFYRLEEELVKQYLKNIDCKFKYSLNIPIKTKQKNIPKYRMIFCTNNKEGLFLMNDNMHKTLLKMRDNELQGQIAFFSLPIANDVESLENYISKILENQDAVNYIDLACEIISQANVIYSEKDIQEKLNEFEDNKYISIKRIPKAGYIPKRQLCGWNYKKYDIIIQNL